MTVTTATHRVHAAPPNPVGPGRYLWRQFWSDRSFACQALASIMLMAIVNLPLPLLNKVVIDSVIPSGNTAPLVWLGLFAFAVRGIASGFQVFQNYVVRRLMSGIGLRLRASMMRRMLESPFERFVSGEIGGYVGRLSTDVSKIENVIFDTIRFVVRPLCMLSVMALVMSCISIPGTLLILFVAPLSVFTTRHLTYRLETLQRQVLARRQDLQERVTEVLDGIRVIRAFGREPTYRDRIEQTIARYSDASVEHATRTRFLQTVIEIIGLLPWLTMVVAGSVLIRGSELSLGDFMLFITFEQLLHSPLGQLSHYLLRVRSEMVATRRVQEVLALPSERRSTPGCDEDKVGENREAATGGAAITIDGITFAYDAPGTSEVAKPVIEGLSFSVRPGQRVAVVGPSGAGKSTLIHLLLGFCTPQQGRIAIDDRAINTIPTDELRRTIGTVFQDNPMFDASIRENLSLGRPVPDEIVWQALERAEARDFVASLPQRLDTLIGVKGLKVSGGQRQRLAIARVLIKAPRLVLLDEATSSLDSLTETLIQRALEELLSHCTSVTIAHRLSTVVGSDRIFYLEAGRIVESGRHDELLAKRGRYYELYRAQVDGML